MRLPCEQPLRVRPGSKQLYRFRYARQIALHDALQAIDLPPPPAIHQAGIKPSNPYQYVDGAHVVVVCERRLRSLGHPICKRGAILGMHGASKAPDVRIGQSYPKRQGLSVRGLYEKSCRTGDRKMLYAWDDGRRYDEALGTRRHGEGVGGVGS